MLVARDFYDVAVEHTYSQPLTCTNVVVVVFAPVRKPEKRAVRTMRRARARVHVGLKGLGLRASSRRRCMHLVSGAMRTLKE